MKNIKQHIAKMDKEKRKILEAMAKEENMTLVEYLTDLHKDTPNSIIVINSTTGDIIQKT